MQLLYGKFETVIDDLKSFGATVTVLANVKEGRHGEDEIDYTIEARWPSGRAWEITEIQPWFHRNSLLLGR